MDISTIMQYATPVLTLVFGWLGGRKKGKAEVSKIEGNALGIMQDTYSQLVTDMKERYNELQEEIDALKSINSKLTASVKKLTSEIKTLKNIN
tara:strand:+ start:1253 stop:1531 length:279 start_codon:yes stop_codon:yes gene_type:complete